MCYISNYELLFYVSKVIHNLLSIDLIRINSDRLSKKEGDDNIKILCGWFLRYFVVATEFAAKDEF